MLLVALGALTAYVAAPLYRRAGGTNTRLSARAADATDRDRAELEARRDVLVGMLREIDLDHRTGALDDAEYERSRSETEIEAAAVIEALE